MVMRWEAFFEAAPYLFHSGHYCLYVEKLKPELVNYTGLIYFNRYRVVSDNYSLLLYQLWDCEKSIENWRKNGMHCLAEKAGAKTHFKDYRIRAGMRVTRWRKVTKSKARLCYQ